MKRCLKIKLLGVTIFVALSLGVGCKPSRPPIPTIKSPDGTPLKPPPAPPKAEEAEAIKLAGEADALEGQGDVTGAALKRDRLVQDYPGTGAGATELERRATANKSAGKVQEAIDLYERLLFHRPDAQEDLQIRESYAELLLKMERVEDAAIMLEPVYRKTKDEKTRMRVGPWLAQSYTKIGQHLSSLHIYVAMAEEKMRPPEQRERARESAREIVAGRLSFQDAKKVWPEVEGDEDWDFLHPALAFKLAKIYYHTREYDESESMLNLVAGRHGNSEYGAPARGFLERLRARFQVEARSIGVLLPLSGKYQQYGNRSLAAIKLAFDGNSPFKLVVKNTAGDPIQTAAALEELVLKDHVIAVIGPLFSRSAHAAALKAEELSVPLLTLSHRDDLPEIGPYVFRTALTVRAQAEALATTAMDNLGLKRFAILHPRSSYGTDFAQGFWDAIDARKGEVRGIESYEHDETTFRNPVRKLVGRWYMLSRPEYAKQRGECKKKKLSPHRERRCMEDAEKSLAPEVDFDAIVIPDSARNIGLIAPALAFEDIVLTHDSEKIETIEKSTGRTGLRPVTLLGGSTWNTTQTLESCERYCERAVFVDGYFPDNPDPKVRSFAAAFREVTGVDPLLSEAQAYDTAGLLKTVMSGQTTSPSGQIQLDRKGLRKLLADLPSYEGVTGSHRFDNQGDVIKALHTLTIRDRSIQLWSPEGPPTPG